MMSEDELVSTIRMMHWSQRDEVARFADSILNRRESKKLSTEISSSIIPEGLIDVEVDWNDPMELVYEKELKALVEEVIQLRAKIKST